MSKTLPYSPMGARIPPAGEQEVAGMFKKLAARSSPNVSVSNETQSPQAKDEPSLWPTQQRGNGLPANPPRPVGPIEWEERLPGSMGRYSKCRWYSVCQANDGDVKTFAAWTRNPLTGGMTLLTPRVATFREAIEVCQKDADEHYARGDR